MSSTTTVTAADLYRLRAQVHNRQSDPERLAAYTAWLNAELAFQPGRLREAGLPAAGSELPAPLPVVPAFVVGSLAYHTCPGCGCLWPHRTNRQHRCGACAARGGAA